MGVSRDDMGFAGAQFWKRSTKQGQRRSNTMRIGLKYIPGARLTTVPNTTHYVQTQRPDIVIDAIRDVIDRS